MCIRDRYMGIGSNPTEREKGRRIAQAFDKQMRQKKEREREEKGELGGDTPTIVSAAHIEELQAKLTKYLKRGAFKRQQLFTQIYLFSISFHAVSYTHLRAHETSLHLVCRLLLEKKKKNYHNNH
eukprot:TRINITY_DN20128_c0_g1_i2.p1 TRINITY_DN20128_c0_g1~~TRINITY_DN20128_c0_g1_i2.p1  ORF type:complete len:125 (+),score=32.92 TRINITY_DN20128_c0_g1_i2:183-557(+)